MQPDSPSLFHAQSHVRSLLLVPLEIVPAAFTVPALSHGFSIPTWAPALALVMVVLQGHWLTAALLAPKLPLPIWEIPDFHTHQSWSVASPSCTIARTQTRGLEADVGTAGDSKPSRSLPRSITRTCRTTLFSSGQWHMLLAAHGKPRNLSLDVRKVTCLFPSGNSSIIQRMPIASPM